jgi:hypothetical protein
MSIYDKPEVTPAWAEGGDRNDIPTNPEIQEGWPLNNIPPTRQRFNWLLNWLSTGVRYFMQRGIPEWDAEEDYSAGSRVQTSDGVGWRALRANTNVQPGTSPSDWVAWGDVARDEDLALYTPDGLNRFYRIRKGDSETPGAATELYGVGASADGKLVVRVYDDATGSLVGDALAISEAGGGVIVDVLGNKLTNLGTGTANGDAVNKGQMDSSLILYASDDADIILNPHGSIQQESTGPFTVGSSSSAYIADQWSAAVSSAGATAQAGVSTGGVSMYDPSYMFIKTATVKASLGALDHSVILQPVEGRYARRLLYGTPIARASWLQFTACVSGIASAVGSVAIRNGANDRSWVQAFNLTAVPTAYAFSVPGDTSGTWPTDNSQGANVVFTHAAGATNQTATLGVWQTGNVFAATTQTNFLATLNAQLNITDVSWKPSNVLLPFRSINWDDELRRCMRYFEKSYDYANAVGTLTNNGAMSSQALSANTFYDRNIPYKVRKRTRIAPQVRSPNNGVEGQVYDLQAGTNVSVGSNVASEYGEDRGNLYFSGGLTAGRQYNYHWLVNARM